MSPLKHLTIKQHLFHAIVERDAQQIGFGTISFTVKIDDEGNPIINTLKVSKSKRRKYGK